MARSEAPDGAGVNIPPPLIYLSALLIGLGISWFVPIHVLPQRVATPLGVVLIAIALTLVVFAIPLFRRANTTITTRDPVTTLITSGIYQYTRNPLYLALTSFFLGLATLANSLWAIVLIIPVVLIIRYWVIAREERYLQSKFGAQYADYTQRVRRWL